MAQQQKLDAEEIARLRQREQSLSSRLGQIQSAVTGGSVAARMEPAERAAHAPVHPRKPRKPKHAGPAPAQTPTPEAGTETPPPQPESTAQ